MRLRRILLVLSVLAFLSAAIGGYLYYATLRESAFKEADHQAGVRLEMIRKSLSDYLSENSRPAKALAGLPELPELLLRPGVETLNEVNARLDLFREALGADVCYLMNREGTTVASSNRNDADSFVGINFAFRPYFQQAMRGTPCGYLALGLTSKKRGAYCSHPVYPRGGKIPIGVAVIKASIEFIENTELILSGDEIVLVTDPQGVIFISNNKNWLYHTVRELSAAESSLLQSSNQFGRGPWPAIGLHMPGSGQARDGSGTQYLVHRAGVDHYPDWQILYLLNLGAVSKKVSGPLIRITGPIVLILCALIGLSVFLLYRKASQEIRQRREIEEALRRSEERYRTIYHHAPAMLHSVDNQGRITRVSEHWLKVLGYEREEVIGRELDLFLSPESAGYFKQTGLPEFLQTGTVADIPYRFVKKSGAALDVLLSAIGERNEKGEVVRSLAVSIDVTERKRAEEALKQAKEGLTAYSRDLECQVRKRTGEITAILKYSPSVIYIKDRQGRYVLVNSRFETLFGITQEEIQGKTDDAVFPKEISGRFQDNDAQVLALNRPLQFEEQVSQNDGPHTYLSVKFPVYDESGEVSGVCGISADVTALKKAQNQLRRLSAAVMESQEKERAALARELHDELGQMLTALRLDAVWILEHLKEKVPNLSERTRAMRDLIDETIESVRSLALRLRPGILDTLGLVDALEWHTEEFEKRTDMTCIFEHRSIPVLSETLATATYRIAQEALTNVARHAGASIVKVTLQQEDHRLFLSVADNGIGFRPEELSESAGLGVAGMQERAMLVGGTLEIRSRPNSGTEVRFQAPLMTASKGGNP